MADRKPLTYADAGVDIKAQDEAAKAVAGLLTHAREGVGAPLTGVGHYAGLVDFGDHALVLCTDGVGSKLEIANAMEKWNTVGVDCMAMNVNDAICVGAEPIAFVDYLAIDDPDPAMVREIGKGLAEGARQANVTVVGGETAILPGIVKGFDLAGTCLAYARKDRLVTGDAIQPGDVIIGVESSGIHSNGYTLARRAAKEAGADYHDEVLGGEKLGHVLLEPTRIYVRAALDLLDAVEVKGIAHVTGSGLLNLPRLNGDVRYVLDEPLDPHPVFGLVQEWGRVETAEMYRTFNMGMGLAVVVAEAHATAAVDALNKHHPARVVGRVAEGHGVDVPTLDLRFTDAKF